MRTRKRLFLAFLVLVTAAAVVYGVTRVRASAPSLATAQAVRGDFEVIIKARGEVKALRSVTLVAPTSLTDVQILSLVPAGTLVKEGDVVIELDTTSQQDRLNQRMSAIKQVDAEMDRLKAQNRIQDEADSLDLVQAQFNVERAKLEVSKQEIVSEIDAGKAKLTLKNTERALQEVQARISAHKRAQEADIDAVHQRRKKAENDVALNRRNLERMTIKSPISGILQVMPNFRAGSRMFGGGGGSAPEFKPGDRAWPGAGIAEIPDLNSLSVELAIEETDRGRIAVGQSVRVKVDALSDQLIPGGLESISPLSQINYSVRPPQKTFRAMVKLDLSKLGPLIKVKPRTEGAQAEQQRDSVADGRRGREGRGGRGSRAEGGPEGNRMASRRAGGPEAAPGLEPGSPQRPPGTEGQPAPGIEGGARAGMRTAGPQAEEMVKKLKEKGIDAEELMKKIREGGDARTQALQQLRESGIDFGGRRQREGGSEGGPGAGTRAEAAPEGGAPIEMRRERRGTGEGSGPGEGRGQGEGREFAVRIEGPGGPPMGGGSPGGNGAGMPRDGNGRGPQAGASKRAESTLRPGMSAGGDIVVERLKDVVLIPVRATFDRGGKVLVYVKKGRDFEPREIVIGHRGEAQVEVRKGLQPGEVVALEEPASAKAKKS